MDQRKRGFYVTVLVLAITMFHICYTEVFTSSKKIEDMVLQEQQILSKLQAAVTEMRNETASLLFSKFYKDQILKVEERRLNTHTLENLNHPNGIYFSIKLFAAEYENIRSELNNAPSLSVKKQLSSVADQRDVIGARTSFLRLQTVYNLSTSDMIRGNYFGRLGPELSQEDVLEIGHAALDGGRVDLAIEWLEAALRLDNHREPTAGFNQEAGTSLTVQIHALLGRAYNHQGNSQKAGEMYRRAVNSNPNHVLVKQLERELESKPQLNVNPHNQRPFKDEFQRLCKLQNKLTTGKFDRRLNCTYRHVLLPYNRYKMELISVSPYVALFFEVITDLEISGMINYVTDKLARGHVVVQGQNNHVDFRTSDISFVSDMESPVADRLSKRVGAITYLDAVHCAPDRFFSSSAFQVVNYGMGGHYDVHMDSFDDDVIRQNKEDIKFSVGGNRLATFLIYLSDVEKGGSTAFPLVDIAVSPVKKMALFWYNFEPSGKQDMLTHHAACPVLFGQKWGSKETYLSTSSLTTQPNSQPGHPHGGRYVGLQSVYNSMMPVLRLTKIPPSQPTNSVTNKWIYLNANMFNRRCGLTETATQLDIDQYMARGWV